MKTLRAILVDDEPDCTEVFAWMLREHCPEVQILSVYNDAEKAAAEIADQQPDVLFLDIEMPRLNGFQLLEKLMPVQYKVVFTTAYDQFALKAFKYSAVDYLMKPVDKEDLLQAVNKIKSSQAQSVPETLETLLHNLKRSRNEIPRLVLPTLEGLNFIQLDDIIRCESDSNYTTFYLTSQQKIVASKTMKEFEPILEENNFFRTHHSHIINLNRIVRYIRGDGGYVIMSDGSQIAVSRSRKEAFLARIQ